LLMSSGCLKESDNRGYRIDGKKNVDGTPFVEKDVHWIDEPSKLEERLQTEKPGEAIWSAWRMGDKALPVLKELLKSDNENIRKHAAFALSILGSRDGLDILREMAISRDELLLKDCRKHNNLRGCMAIYWLGRLGDREITSELIDLISDPNEKSKEVYHQKNVQTTRYKIADFEDVYFQFMSQAVMALVRIGDIHVDLRSQIGKAFTDAFEDDDYYYRITKRPKLSSEGNMVQALKNVAYSAAQCWKEQKSSQ